MEHISSLHGATFLVLSTKIPIFKAKWFRKKMIPQHWKCQSELLHLINERELKHYSSKDAGMHPNR